MCSKRLQKVLKNDFKVLIKFFRKISAIFYKHFCWWKQSLAPSMLSYDQWRPLEVLFLNQFKMDKLSFFCRNFDICKIWSQIYNLPMRHIQKFLIFSDFFVEQKLSTNPEAKGKKKTEAKWKLFSISTNMTPNAKRKHLSNMLMLKNSEINFELHPFTFMIEKIQIALATLQNLNSMISQKRFYSTMQCFKGVCACIQMIFKIIICGSR